MVTTERMCKEVYEAIKGRRSVRVYDGRVVPKEVLSRIFEAARWAPSAHNAQPWRFIIIEEPEVKKRLIDAMSNAWLRDLKRNGIPERKASKIVEDECVRRFTGSPALIVVCLSMRGMDVYPDERRRRAEYIMAVQSLAAAIQNILLAIHVEGLGACWVCAPLFCQDTVRSVLKLPEDFEPQAIITLGYPTEKPSPPPRKPLNEFVWLLTSREGLIPWRN